MLLRFFDLTLLFKLVNVDVQERRVTFRTIVDAVHIMHKRAQQRHELAVLSDHQLKDIGVSRVDAMNEAEKPFWQE